MIPNKGKIAKGISAVTEIETASVIHQATIQMATANTSSASALMISKGRL